MKNRSIKNRPLFVYMNNDRKRFNLRWEMLTQITDIQRTQSKLSLKKYSHDGQVFKSERKENSAGTPHDDCKITQHRDVMPREWNHTAKVMKDKTEIQE